MHIERFRAYCLALPGVTEGFPFNATTLVFKVGGKMFALADIDEFVAMNLKCDPERAVELRESYAGIQAGWHMNKTHWNTVAIDEDVPEDLQFELIDLSYRLVRDSLPRKIRESIVQENISDGGKN